MATEKHLYYLEELPDYKVASGDCDVRGWEVKDADSQTVGKVDDFLVSKSAERVLYLDVLVNRSLIEEGYETYGVQTRDGIHEFLDRDGENHLIIPVGLVNLDEDNKWVLASDINSETFAKVKRFSKGTPINREYEITLMHNYLPSTIRDSATGEEHFYKQKEFANKLGGRSF